MIRGLAVWRAGGLLLAAACAPLYAANPVDVATLEAQMASLEVSNPIGSVSGYEDKLLLTQSGDAEFTLSDQDAAISSSGTVTQSGSGNAAGLFQGPGTGNLASITQNGNNNFVAISQNGLSNSSTVSQVGDLNRVTNVQTGGANSLVLTQTNNLNVANINQAGNSQVNLTQSGSSSATFTVQGTAASPVTYTVNQAPGTTITVTAP